MESSAEELSGSLKVCDDGLGEFGGGFGASEIGSAVGGVGEGLADGVFDFLGGFFLAEPIEHHGGGEDGADGVGFALAGDVGSGAVTGLEDGAIGADVAGGGHAHAADDAGGEVGEDVSEHVFGDDDVEGFGTLDEEEGGGVDVDVFGGDGGEVLSDLVEDFAEEDHGGEDVCFVDEGDFLVGAVSADGFFESVAADTLAAFSSKMKGVGGGGAVVGLGRAAGGEEAFGVFADDGEVDFACGVAFEGGVVFGIEFDGAGARVEVEAFAEIDLGGHFTTIGPADRGESHGSKENGVGIFAGLEGGFRKGVSGAEKLSGADGLFGKGELIGLI